MNCRLYLRNLNRYSLDDEEYLISVDGDRVYFREVNLEIGAEKLTQLPPLSYRLEKFTGAYDTNKRPIYVGDIIK